MKVIDNHSLMSPICVQSVAGKLPKWVCLLSNDRVRFTCKQRYAIHAALLRITSNADNMFIAAKYVGPTFSHSCKYCFGRNLAVVTPFMAHMPRSPKVAFEVSCLCFDGLFVVTRREAIRFSVGSGCWGSQSVSLSTGVLFVSDQSSLAYVTVLSRPVWTRFDT